MAMTTEGKLRELIAGINDRGLPTSAALAKKLREIADFAAEDEKYTQDLHRKLCCARNPIGQEADYAKLSDVLGRAFSQATEGKGKDRHVKADGQKFEDQPICTLQRIYGNGYAFGQVGKKMEESMRMPKEQAVAEMLGAINYLAAAIIVREEND